MRIALDHVPGGPAVVGVVACVVSWSSGALDGPGLWLHPAASSASATTASAAANGPRPPRHYVWTGRPFASRARWRDHVSSTISVLVPGDPAAAAQLLDHLAEALDVGHLEPDERVGVAGRGEHRLHLGELHGRLLDLLQVGRTGEAHLGEGLDRAPGLAVVDDDGVAGDHPGALQALDAPGHGRGGQRDLLTDVGHGPAGVLRQQFDDVVIDRIELLCSHGSEA